MGWSYKKVFAYAFTEQRRSIISYPRDFLASVALSKRKREQSTASLLSDVFLLQNWDGSYRVSTLGPLSPFTQTAIFLLLVSLIAHDNSLSLSPYQRNVEKSLKFLCDNLELREKVTILTTFLALFMLQIHFPSIKNGKDFDRGNLFLSISSWRKGRETMQIFTCVKDRWSIRSTARWKVLMPSIRLSAGEMKDHLKLNIPGHSRKITYLCLMILSLWRAVGRWTKKPYSTISSFLLTTLPFRKPCRKHTYQ